MTEKQEIDNLLMEAYGRWLLEFYPDEIHNSDQHIEAQQEHLHIEDFIEYVKENI